MKMGKECKLLLALFMILQFAGFFAVKVSAQGMEDAESAINDAKTMLASAFKAVKGAEISGANVTFLSEKLTYAGRHLTSAFLLCKAQNFSLAESNAVICYSIAQSAKGEAEELMGYPAGFERFQYFSWGVVAYIISLSFISGGSIVSWELFKKRYFRKVMEMQPEVVS